TGPGPSNGPPSGTPQPDHQPPPDNPPIADRPNQEHRGKAGQTSRSVAPHRASTRTMINSSWSRSFDQRFHGSRLKLSRSGTTGPLMPAADDGSRRPVWRRVLAVVRLDVVSGRGCGWVSVGVSPGWWDEVGGPRARPEYGLNQTLPKQANPFARQGSPGGSTRRIENQPPHKDEDNLYRLNSSVHACCHAQ
ncbi:MAG: hypothetical protein JWN95_3371, partial [Frankiales bacterium]|nr:hypothetical protein [Frankiales bacterium]